MPIPIVCTLDTCPLDEGYVHYRPSVPGNAFMIAAFALLIFPALYLGIRYKTGLYTGVFVMGLIGEIIGYAGRILLYQNPFSKVAFLIYLICLTLAPVFMTAAIYITLSRIVVLYGENISFVRPRSYTFIFTGFDIAALVIQAAGGAIAAVAEESSEIQQGTHILVAGLSVQVASLVAFAAFSAHFAWRVRTKKEQRNTKHEDLQASRKFRLFLWSLGITTLLIFIRSCYRTAELSGGFKGHLAQDQVAFMILDGALILSACILLTAQNPGQVMGSAWPDTAYSWGRASRHRDSSHPAFELRSSNADGEASGDLKAGEEPAQHAVA